VFAEHGHAAGTTNRIAAEAGLSIGSLYQYFPNKDAILVELVREHIQRGTEAVLASAHPHDGTVDEGDGTVQQDELAPRLRAVIAALVDLHAGERRLHQVLFEESPRPPALLAELRAIEDVAVQVLVGWIGPWARTGTDVELTARIVAVTIESLVHRLVATDRPIDLVAFADEAGDLVLGYLATRLRP
jgi:AcrR family transcriptional regulator